MTEDEKTVLRKAINSSDGLLSPATIINSCAEGRRQIVEKLVSFRYLEMVPEEIHTGKVINFYRVTENGFAVFYPTHKKAWHLIKNDIKIVGIAVITSVLTTLATLLINSFI